MNTTEGVNNFVDTGMFFTVSVGDVGYPILKVLTDFFVNLYSLALYSNIYVLCVSNSLRNRGQGIYDVELELSFFGLREHGMATDFGV